MKSTDFTDFCPSVWQSIEHCWWWEEAHTKSIKFTNFISDTTSYMNTLLNTRQIHNDVAVEDWHWILVLFWQPVTGIPFLQKCLPNLVTINCSDFKNYCWNCIDQNISWYITCLYTMSKKPLFQDSKCRWWTQFVGQREHSNPPRDLKEGINTIILKEGVRNKQEEQRKKKERNKKPFSGTYS